MTSNTIFLVTGSNRGIGLGLVLKLLDRPNTTVIATIRSSSTTINDLKKAPTASGSKLIITVLSSTSDAGAFDMIKEISTQGVTHIDTIIANAGSGETFQSSLDTPMEKLRSNFDINTLGPIKLFQAAYPLLSRSANPKFILISSSLGSIGDMEEKLPSLAYGVSKAAANYFVRKVHFEHEGITAVALHPGWVKTSNGQAFADIMGIAEPPMTLGESVGGVLTQIDVASRSTTSGTLVSYDGTVIAW